MLTSVRLHSAMLLCLLASACGAGAGRTAAAGPAPAPPADASPPGTGEFRERTFRWAEGDRAYRLYVPSGYDGRSTVPLVVMLHGCIQDPVDMAAGTRMNEVAEEHIFLVAYPEQPASANPQRCWNWYLDEHQQRDRGEPALIAALARALLREFQVDARRVYVAGMSAGGAMSMVMAATYPDLFAAAGSHSGIGFALARSLEEGMQLIRNDPPLADLRGERLVEAIGAHGRVVPVIVFQGGADPVVHPVNAPTIVEQWRLAHAAVAGETAPALAEQRQGRTPDGVDYTVTLARAAATTAELWTVPGLGHAWSGGAPAGTFTDPTGPDATREMVRFFLAHSLP
jgi:poly(hydroxyalkanoate) depolymerase family esterase